jgi:phage baseplate assembly protein V
MPLKFGVVTQIDAANCRVRVQYKDNEGIESYWLAVLQRKTTGDRDYHLPEVGEHVACQVDEHNEEGVVLGAIYSSADPAPVQDADKRHLAFKDGSVFEYDRNKHRLTADMPGGQARVTVGKEGYVEIKGATVVVLHDAADIDCRKVLNVRAKDGIVYWIPGSSARPYEPVVIPPVED